MLSFDSVKLILDREHSLIYMLFNFIILLAYVFLEINKNCNLGLFTQHTAEEFDIKLLSRDSEDKNMEVPVTFERTWVAQHEHDDEVGSFAIEREGDVDIEKMNAWLSKLLAEKGVDIFRMKGFISIADDPRRFVFQGVHMLFDSQPEREWAEGERRNQIVFIGRNLDEEAMQDDFDKCLV